MGKKELTYNNIQKEAETFAAQYRKENDIPDLPSLKQTRKYKDVLHSEFADVIDLVKQRLSLVESEGGHGFEHLEDVSTRAGYIADTECKFRHVSEELAHQVIRKALLAGILHDIERHRGFGEDHVIEGAKTARVILEKVGQVDETVITVVRNHDDMNYDTGNDLILSLVFGSIWDADHFRYGLER